MKQEHYTQVAFIALRNKDGSLLTDVPLYVRNSEVNGAPVSHEELLHNVSAVMVRRYEKQIHAHFANLKKEQIK